MRIRWFSLIISLVMIVFCALILAVIWIWPSLNSVSATEQSAVAFALTHTPIVHVEQVQWFTGAGTEQTVIGTDASHRKMYVFVQGQRANIVYADQVVTKQHAIQSVLALKQPITAILSATPGYEPANSLTYANNNSIPQDHPVWEITANLANHNLLFAFVDMYSGAVLNTFSTTHAVLPLNP